MVQRGESQEKEMKVAGEREEKSDVYLYCISCGATQNIDVTGDVRGTQHSSDLQRQNCNGHNGWVSTY